jgi:hypothetical protein
LVIEAEILEFLDSYITIPPLGWRINEKSKEGYRLGSLQPPGECVFLLVLPVV